MSTQRHRHTAEDPKAYRIPRGTGRIIPGMHNRGPQRTVESQKDKTQANDETNKIATWSCTPSYPHHAPQAPPPPPADPKNTKTPSCTTQKPIPHPRPSMHPRTSNYHPQSPRPIQIPNHAHEPHKTQGLI